MGVGGGRSGEIGCSLTERISKRRGEKVGRRLYLPHGLFVSGRQRV